MDGLFTDGLCTGAMICELLRQLVLEVSEGDKESPASVIFAVRSSHWQQRTGMKGGQRRNWLWGVTSEIYMLERVLL
jgi:hypothetical protein